MSKALMDAQDAPGNGPGDGQSPAGSPPQGVQTPQHVYAREAGSTPTAGFEGNNGVQDYAG